MFEALVQQTSEFITLHIAMFGEQVTVFQVVLNYYVIVIVMYREVYVDTVNDTGANTS